MSREEVKDGLVICAVGKDELIARLKEHDSDVKVEAVRQLVAMCVADAITLTELVDLLLSQDARAYPPIRLSAYPPTRLSAYPLVRYLR